MGALEVASLFATIRLDDQLTGGLQGVQRGLDGMGRGLQNMGAQVSLMTAPIAGAFAFGISTASSFQDVMAEIQARAGLTADEIGRVSDFALQMGADTAFSGQQAADAFLQLLTSGQTVDQAFTTLPAVLDAAAASGEDLGKTADDVTDIMAMFGLSVQAISPEMQALFDAAGLTDEAIASIIREGDSGVPILNQLAETTGLTAEALFELISAEDAASVVDSLARAAGASSASMGDLSDGFKNVGAIANRFGLSANRTAAVLAVLAENGIKGAEGGTALRSMLMNMTRPTEDVAAAWNELGVTFYNADGSTRDLTVIMDDLGAALGALPVEEQNRLMYELTGTYGSSALSALLAANSITDMEEAMANSAAAHDVAQARMNTFSGATDSLKGSIETLMISALTPLMDNVLTPMVQKLTDVVNGIGDWVNENPELTGQIVALAGAAVLLGPALLVAGTLVRALGSAFGVLSGAVTLLTSPIALIVAGFVGVLALGGRLTPLFEGLRDIAEGPLATGLRNIADGIGAFIDGNQITGTILLMGGVRGLADALGDMVALTFDNLVQALENITGLDISSGLTQLGDFLSQVANWASASVIQPVVDGITGLAAGVQGFIDTLTSDVDPAALQGILEFIGQLGVALGALVGAAVQVGGQAVGATFQAIGDALPSLATGLASVINTVGGLLNGSIDPGQALVDMANAVKDVGAALLSIPVGAADGLITALNSLDGEGGIDLPTLTEIGNAIGGVFEDIRTAVQTVIDTLSGAWAIVQPFVQPIVDWFTTTFAAVGQEGGAVDVVTQAFNALSTLLQSIWAAIEPGVTALANGINGVLQPVKDLIDGINAGFESLRGMGGIISEAQNAVAASGVDREALWQLALEQAGGNDLVARIVFGQLEGSLAGRAAGGPVSGGMPYLVGERGPELFMPAGNGRIVPNHALGGGGVTVVVNSYGQTPYDFATLVERALRDKGF